MTDAKVRHDMESLTGGDLTGEGELIMDIVLMAGLWLDGSAWNGVVPALEALGHRPVPLTLPGQGAGPRSAACTLAWLAADARPEKVAKVVLIGGSPSPIGTGDVPELAKVKHLRFVNIDSGHWPMISQAPAVTVCCGRWSRARVSAMRLRKFGHCCLVLEDKGERLLLDPGVFSSDFSEIDGLTAVLITHVHPDHLDVDRLHPLLERNPAAVVLCDERSATALAQKGVPGRVLHGGDVVDVGVSLRVYETEHAVIHPELPNVPNLGYLVDDRFFYGGDAFITPDEPVEVLAVPVGGAWMKASESIDYLRSIAPRVAVPVHDHQDVWADWVVSLFRELGPASTTVRTLAGETAEEV